MGDESAVYARSSSSAGGGSQSSWTCFDTVARLHSLLLSLHPQDYKCDAQLLCELRRHYAYVVRAIREREVWAESVSLAATARTASLITECKEQSEKLSRLVCQQLNGRGRSRSLGRTASSGTAPAATVEDEERTLKGIQSRLAKSRVESDRVYQWYKSFQGLRGAAEAVPRDGERFRFWVSRERGGKRGSPAEGSAFLSLSQLTS